MLVYKNKEFRNLQEQVLKNAQDIEILKEKPNLSISIVDELPEVGQEGILYLVPSQDPALENAYDEYVWLPESESFEMVGSTAIDLSNMVTTDTEQSISGSKTFTSPIIVGAAGYDIKKDGSNIVIEADGNDVKVRGGLAPNANATYSIGTNGLKWSNIHLNNSLLLGNNTTAGQGQITFKNPDVSNQGNWYITSPDQSGLSIMQDTQNTGVKISRGNMYPLTTGYFELGNGSYRWKSLHLSHYVTWGNNVLIGKDASNRFYVTDSSGTTKIKVGTNETYFANDVEPDATDTYNLGRAAMRWKNLFVNNLIRSDLTPVPVDVIVTKPNYDNPNVWASGKLASGTGSATIDYTDLTGVGVPDWGLYMFTYGNAQCYVAFTESMWLGMLAGYPIRVACPCLEEAGGSVEGNTGNLKIEKTGTVGIIKVTVASTITGSATSTNGWDFQFIKVI